MKKKRTIKSKPMHVIEFAITEVENHAHPRDAFDKRFFNMWIIHNIVVKEAQRRLTALMDNKLYRALRQKYHRLKQQNEKDPELKELAALLSRMQREYRLSKFDLEKYAQVCGRKYRNTLSSQQVQKEAARVWKGAESVLYGNGKRLHFCKLNEFMSISQESVSNGIKAELASGRCIWNGLRFEAHIDRWDPYVADALLADVSYFEIKRRMFESGWRYYLVVVLQGAPPKKINDIKREGATPGGIDSGPSTLAYVSEKKAILTRLALCSEAYGKRIRHLQRENDQLLRNMNAENYNPDGTVRKGRHKWKSSSRIRKNKRLIKTLYRKKAEYIRQSHYELVNQIISDCSELYLEPMHYKALQRRSSRTERSEKICTMQKKDGTVIAVHKYKKKKRFGKSIGDHAPAEMITLLKQRCEQYHIPVHETNCRTMKASQYNPLTGEYESSDLNIRIKKIGKHNVQRDLLSAYITANADETLTYPDPERCLSHWEQFLRVHDKEISRMKAEGISFKSCFGF